MPKNKDSQSDKDLTIEDIEEAMAEAGEIEAEKNRKRREREQRKFERELKKKRDKQMKLVAPIMLVVTAIISFGLYLFGQLGQ